MLQRVAGLVLVLIGAVLLAGQSYEGVEADPLTILAGFFVVIFGAIVNLVEED